jgi:outer membrane biogenesis lipoprotein LolB
MRTLTLMAASLLLAACSTQTQHMVGNDQDIHGCRASAGYQWSALTNQCVRLFEQAVRLQSLEANETGSAFVLFNADQSQAELTLPSGEQTRLTRQGDEGNWSWQGGAYQLFPWKGYLLKSGEQALFHGDSAL